MKIKSLQAREILDSRGNPTLEVEVIAESKTFLQRKSVKAWSGVPSGASTGDFEAVELRDGNKKRFAGKGVLQAVKNVNETIAPALLDIDVLEQKKIDQKMIELDGTDNKSRLGANAIVGVSMAVARVGAIASGKKLFEYIAELSENDGPILKVSRPFFNVINGGVHAGNKLAFQEFMISPNLGSFQENYRGAAEVYHALKEIIKENFGSGSTLVGDEGGFAPIDFYRESEALDILMQAIQKAGYEKRVDIALDVAASEFFVDGRYNLGFKTKEDDFRTTEEMMEHYLELVEKYPIISLEDPFEQNDFKSFAKLRKILQKKGVQVVGDDLTVSNPQRIKQAIKNKSCNALLLKINQIGTVSEAIEAFKLAQKHNWRVMVSHRSGETPDDFIADFAVGLGAEQIKSGATARGERTVKYNRLLALEKFLK